MAATLVLTELVPVAEPPAWSLLQRAQGFLQKWPEGFDGYRAHIRCEAGGRIAQGRVVVARGQAPVVELEVDDLRELVAARLLEHVDERTPRFFKDGDGRFQVDREPAADGEAWIRVERPEGCVRYRLDPRGRIGAIERCHGERRTLTVIEEYARATPGRVLPARRRTSIHDARTDLCVGRQLLQETHCRVEHVWLSAGFGLESETGLGTRACRVELLAHQLL